MRKEPAPRTVIYDDRCGFCARSARVLQALDKRRAYRYEGISNEAALRACGVSALEAGKELKLASEGQIWGGYEAVVEILGTLPSTSWLTPVLRFAPVRWFGRRAYKWAAARRHRRPPSALRP